jgi:hypothetical protein
MDDEDEIQYEVGQNSDGTLWKVSVSCNVPISEREFAAALASLASDMLSGDVTFDGCPSVDDH